MANKTHCDICDVVGAQDKSVHDVKIPGRPHWDRKRLTVTVVVTEGRPGGGESYTQKDICVDCARKLVADAFALRTPQEYNELRDSLNELSRKVIDTTLGPIEAEPAASEEEEDISL